MGAPWETLQKHFEDRLTTIETSVSEMIAGFKIDLETVIKNAKEDEFRDQLELVVKRLEAIEKKLPSDEDDVSDVPKVRTR